MTLNVWPKAIFTSLCRRLVNMAVGQKDWGRPNSQGVALGYGGKRPSARHSTLSPFVPSVPRARRRVKGNLTKPQISFLPMRHAGSSWIDLRSPIPRPRHGRCVSRAPGAAQRHLGGFARGEVARSNGPIPFRQAKAEEIALIHEPAYVELIRTVCAEGVAGLGNGDRNRRGFRLHPEHSLKPWCGRRRIS